MKIEEYQRLKQIHDDDPYKHGPWEDYAEAALVMAERYVKARKFQVTPEFVSHIRSLNPVVDVYGGVTIKADVSSQDVLQLAIGEMFKQIEGE